MDFLKRRGRPRPVGEIRYDLDGVLLHFSHTARHLLNHDGYFVNPSDSFKWTTTPELSANQIWKYFKDAYRLWRITPIFDGAAELLNAQYHMTGKPITIITARPKAFAQETYNTIDRISPVPFKMVLAEGNYKHLYLEPDDIIIEDRRKTVLNLAHIGVRSIIVDRIYNQIENPPSTIHRVSGLPEIQEMLPMLLER